MCPPSQVREPVLKRYDLVEIARPRVLDALAATDGTRVQLLCALPGGGKTTALLHYAAEHSGAALVSLPRDATKKHVARLLAGVRDAQVVVIDDADLASPGGREAVVEEIERNRGGGRYLLSGSSRTRMPVQQLLRHGGVRVLDASLLAFTSSEIRRFAEAHGVAAGDLDVEQLKYETDGWPLAVAWIVRDAAHNGYPLGSAFDPSRRRIGHLLLEVVAAALGERDSMGPFLAATRSFAEPASQRALEQFEGEGYPVVRTGASLRPYRNLMRLDAETPGAPVADPVDDRLAITLFGRFSCKIRGRSVPFVRRRDKNVLAFVALAPAGGATRDELRDAFWPNASPAAASQGLRTTLSRLRLAIAEAAADDADRYLRVDGWIRLDLDHVWIDVHRFHSHMASAKLAETGGQRSVARNHYRQAQRLHAGSLLSSEAVEGALAPHVVTCEALFELAASQLAVLDAG